MLVESGIPAEFDHRARKGRRQVAMQDFLGGLVHHHHSARVVGHDQTVGYRAQNRINLFPRLFGFVQGNLQSTFGLLPPPHVMQEKQDRSS